MSFYAELRRRNVLRVAVAYATASWLLIQVADTIFPVYGLGPGAMNALITVLAIGLPLSMLFSWVFELTPEGLKRESEVDRAASSTARTGKKLDRAIIALLTLALGYFAVDKFVLDPARDAELVEKATQAGRNEALIESYGEKSIAVLPFADMSQEGDQEYFSDGIAEELLNLLAKIPELRVISRSSAFAFKSQDLDIPSIAAQLNVAHVLEGSVRKAGNRVRITAQLIEARSDTHLWSETYDREFDDVFAIQDEIASAVVGQLKVTLLGDRPRVREVDPDAYALFLQGRHFNNQGSIESYREARTFLEQALAIEPEYAAAWAELGRTIVNQVSARILPTGEAYPDARAASDRAIELDPLDAVALSRRGYQQMDFEGDLAAAADSFTRALALEPGNAIVLANAGALAKALGRMDEAIRLEELALQRDPLNSAIHDALGVWYLYRGSLAESEAMFRKALLLSPDRLGTSAMLGRVLLAQGRHEEAMAAVEQEPLVFLRLAGLAIANFDIGNIAESDAALATLKEGYADVAGIMVAIVHATRGELDPAFEWLRKAVDAEGPRSLMNLKFAPELTELRADPRWRALLADHGISQDQLAAIEFEVNLPD
jgi:adenylate cyclase